MNSLKERAEEFILWITTLKQVTSDKTGTPIHEIKINEESAYEYFKSGFTPTQCFREEWANYGN